MHSDDISWLKPVLGKRRTCPPKNPHVGDRFLIAGTDGAWSGFEIGDVVEKTESGWDVTKPQYGNAVYVFQDGIVYRYNGGRITIDLGRPYVSSLFNCFVMDCGRPYVSPGDLRIQFRKFGWQRFIVGGVEVGSLAKQDLPPSKETEGFVPKIPDDNTKFLNGKGLWATPAGGGGSGVQTASNIGAGVGIFKQRVADDLEFKKLDSLSDAVVISPDVGGNKINVQLDQSKIDHGNIVGLADDDHTQYHNDARGDARYSQLDHTHDASGIVSGTLLPARLPNASVSAKGAVELATDGEELANRAVQGNDSRLSNSRTPLPHTHVEADVDGLVSDLAGKAPTSRSIATTAPLAGGGDLSSDRTLTVSNATTTAVGVVELATDGEATSGVVVQGNDSRLNNARTPTAHAVNHKSGGTDVIKLDELAAPSDNTTLDANVSAHGLCPKLSGSASDVLKGNGTFGAVSGVPSTVKLTSDAAGIATTTMSDVAGMLLALAANSYYHFKFVIRYTSNNTTYGAGFAVNAPAGATVQLLTMVGITNAASGTPTMRAANAVNTPNANIGASVNDTNAQTAIVEGIVFTGGTAGNLQLRGAIENAAASLVVKQGSCGILTAL